MLATSPPPIPPNAAPWALVQAVGRPGIEAAWEKCFQAGKVAGAVESGLSFGGGVFCGAAGALALVGLGVLVILTVLVVFIAIRSRPRKDHFYE